MGSRDVTDRSGWMQSALKLFTKSKTQILSPESAEAMKLRSSFLDTSELAFYQSLAMAIGNRGFVSCKTRAINVVDVNKASTNLSHAIRLNLKTIHFLVCDRDESMPLVAIQVSRGKPGQPVKADPFLVTVLKSADLPLLTIDLSAPPTTTSLRQILQPLFDQAAIGQRKNAANCSGVEQEQSVEQEKSVEPDQSVKLESRPRPLQSDTPLSSASVLADSAGSQPSPPATNVNPEKT